MNRTNSGTKGNRYSTTQHFYLHGSQYFYWRSDCGPAKSENGKKRAHPRTPL